MDLETGNGGYSSHLWEPQSYRPTEVPQFIAELNETMLAMREWISSLYLYI